MDIVIGYTMKGTIRITVPGQINPNMPIDNQLTSIASSVIKGIPSHELIQGVIQTANKGKATVCVTNVKHIYDDGKMIGIAL